MTGSSRLTPSPGGQARRRVNEVAGATRLRGSQSKTAIRSKRPHLVSAANFVLATRDTGYKNTALAVAEFVDNSIEAGASSVAIEVLTVADQLHPTELLITDDGMGMDADTLASALTFGGSTHFGDRSSLGRYGMGLPNAALSRGRRLEVYTWQGPEILMARLDVDEVVATGRRTLSPVEVVSPPIVVPRTAHGTTVRVMRCDRLEYKRTSTLIGKLREDLGRIYRRFLARGLDLRVNGEPLTALDPVFLQPSAKYVGGRQFGDALTYQLVSEGGSGVVEVRFSELPIERWHNLSLEDKRRIGVTSAPCVSIMRADREIDRGWYFMGAKRRQNYDDWWRCEVSFDPSLDELFGITHAKQTISPSEELLKVLVPDLEPIARALNSRVRDRFELVKVTSPLGAAEQQAARAEKALPALPRRRDAVPEELKELIQGLTTGPNASPLPYQIVVSELPTTLAFEVVLRRRQLVVLFNARHPLYRDLYGPLALSDLEKDRDVAKRVALAVLAAARAEVTARRQSGRAEIRQFRQTWADVLATFFNA